MTTNEVSRTSVFHLLLAFLLGFVLRFSITCFARGYDIFDWHHRLLARRAWQDTWSLGPFNEKYKLHDKLSMTADQAVQTVDADQTALEQELTKNLETERQLDESTDEIEGSPQSLHSNIQELELDDLGDLEGHIYDRQSSSLTASIAELASKEPAFKLAVHVIHQTFGQMLPRTCTNQARETNQAQEELDKMKQFLRQFVCRYAVSNGHVDLLSKIMTNIPRQEYFGLFKLAIDTENLLPFQTILRHVPTKEIDPEFKLPAVLEYAALRGSLQMMEALQQIGINVDGDETTHPLSAAIAGGCIGTVKMLIEWGARLDGRDKKSIVKEYTQTPIVIAARHHHLGMVTCLVSHGAPLRESETDYDALTIAVTDRRSKMIACLIKSGIALNKLDPPLEKFLEIAVDKGNAELAEMLLKAGADPDAEERCIGYRPNNPEVCSFFGYSHERSSLYGTLFQWACALNHEDIVRLFLEHGVNFDKPLVSWANWYENKPIYVAWSCGNTSVVRLILEYYEGAELLQLACHAVERGYLFLLVHMVEIDEVRRQSSWLLRRCLLRLRKISEPGMSARASIAAVSRYPETIKTLIGMGAWLPPDTTWRLSEDLLFRLGYKTLDQFLAACAL